MKHAESALEGSGCPHCERFHCVRFAPGELSSRREFSPALLTVLAPLPLRRRVNFHEVRGCCPGSSATPGHPHTQLHRRLVDFSSFRADGSSTSRCRSRSDERVGVKAKCKEKCAVSITENHLSRRGVGFDHDAGTVVPCLDRVDSHHSQESQRRPVTHGQAVSKNSWVWWQLRPTWYFLACCTWDPYIGGSSPRGSPRGESRFAWSRSRNASDGCIPYRLGGGHEWPPCPRSVEWSPSHVAHQLPGDAGRVSSIKTFSSGPKKSQCASMHRQHSCGFLYQPPGRSSLAPLIQAGAPDPCVVPGQVPLAESSLYSWESQCRSRHPVEAGAEARGMEASPRGGEADLESFWPGTGGSVCDSSDIALSPLVLSDSSSSAPGSSRESVPGWSPAVASSPILAGPSMVLGPGFSPQQLSMGDSSQEGSPLTGGGYDPLPPPRVMEAMGVAPALSYIFSEESWGSAGPFGGPSFLDFAPGLSKAFLYPRAGYVPKVPSSVPWPVVLQVLEVLLAFCPPPFREPDQEKLNCMCPVQALDAYVHRTVLWRKTDQLLVCYGPPKKGLPASKQTLSRIVDAIIVAYESFDLLSPLGVKAHSTRGMAASKAFLAGVPIQDICDAAGWSTPLTFVRFYNLDLQATPGTSVLLP